MAGPSHKSIEITQDGETAGYVQVRWIDFDKHGAPRYQWFLRAPDATVMDGGQELRLEPRSNPDTARALVSLVEQLRQAGQAYDYEQLSGERQNFRDDFTEPAAAWAAANLDGLNTALDMLPVHDRSEL